MHGVTVSCQTNGREWGTDAFAEELDRLRALGVNWVAIHPYARIENDGTVRWRGYPSETPPQHLVRPIREARARGLSILIMPHLAYWGSRFRSRNEIDFATPEERARFWSTYRAWLGALAEVVRDADAFSIGNETDRLLGDEAEWRGLIADVRARTKAKLVYAANWSDYERVPFWDALDAIGVQAYFPLAQSATPSESELEQAWNELVPKLRGLSQRTGKPVVFTELGYPCSLAAAREPWSYAEARGADREAAAALQARCLAVALRVLDRERSWLRGAFLWKWFVGPAPGENFLLNQPQLRAELERAWRAAR
ncbi:MAG: hypothetical protein IT453_08440 [Planctomycetes bacterium]|nr:hypothetical protein [Planctomycetota bacterium]